MRHASPIAALGATLVFAALAGCTADTDELQAWMDQQRREAKPSVTPLIPPRKFDPAPYAAAQSVEPFSSQKLSVALKQEARQPNSLLAAELNRHVDGRQRDQAGTALRIAEGRQPALPGEGR
jgi:type IV pilus assembly protein PilP